MIHSNPSSMRRGVLTPVALFVMAIFAILGVVYLFTGSSDYSQSAKTLYGLKAQMLAQAALEEAQAIVYNNVNRPRTGARDPVPPWKSELFSRVEAAVTAGNKGTIALPPGDATGIDLMRHGPLEHTQVIARELASNAEIIECRVRFYGFRKFPYPAGYNVYDPRIYYHNTLLDGPESNLVPNDYIGYYTLRASAKVRGVVRTLAETHDLKVINVAPMAREFALYQGSSVTNGTQSDQDLNRGGALHVHPHGWGRIFMRGPYIVDIEGHSDGAGGVSPVDASDDKRVSSNSFLSPRFWLGWSLMPNPRAGTADREYDGTPVNQMRPEHSSGGITTTLSSVVTSIPGLNLGGSSWRGTGMDAAVFIRSESIWYTGFKDTSDKDFSIIGDPRSKWSLPGSPYANFFSSFPGKRLRISPENSSREEAAYWPSEDLARSGVRGGVIGKYVGDPPHSLEDRWYIVPEANLRARLKLYHFRQPGPSWGSIFSLDWGNMFSLSYNLTLETGVQGGTPQELYALHWEPPRNQSISDMLFSRIVGVLAPSAFLFTPTLGFSALVFNLARPGGFTSETTGFGPLTANSSPGDSSMPRNYKPYSRAATRVYASAGQIRSVKAAAGGDADARLILDGVVWTNKLELNTPMRYIGKGVLGSEYNPDLSADAPSVTGPLLPDENRDREEGRDLRDTRNYLTLYYQAPDGPTAFGGNHMLKIKHNGSVGNLAGPLPTVDGTVYSTQGVKAEGGHVLVFGNMVVGVVNKAKIDPAAKLSVAYNHHLLRKEPTETGDLNAQVRRWMSVDWHQLSVSPRVVGFTDRASERTP